MSMQKNDGSGPTIGILLIDDHAVLRSALRMLLEKQPGMVVIGEASTKCEAIPIATREQPEIILLDVCLVEENGIDLIPELLAVSEESRIIMVTGIKDPAEHQRAIRAGAMGVVHKETSADMLLKAIRRVHAGELWLDRQMTATLVNRLRHDLVAPKPSAEADRSAQLTSRELQIINLVGEGLKNKQIADRLSISEATVRHHLTSVLKKLEVSDRLELLIFAYQHNLIAIRSDSSTKKPAAAAALQSGIAVH
jgi:two-component system, NarL family, nitrate/nitrite response regulator NarL